MRTDVHGQGELLTPAFCLFLSNISLKYEGRYWPTQIDDISLWPPELDTTEYSTSDCYGTFRGIYKQFTRVRYCYYYDRKKKCKNN
jgi:hypothetical protein